MKKRLLLVIAVVIALCAVCGLAACSPPEHVHDFKGEWNYDEHSHWKTCPADGERNFVGSHYDDDNNGCCDECGADIGKNIESIFFDEDVVVIPIGTNGTLTYNVQPADAWSEPKVTIDNPILTFSEGTVFTATQKGIAHVTVAIGGKSATCTVYVLTEDEFFGDAFKLPENVFIQTGTAVKLLDTEYPFTYEFFPAGQTGTAEFTYDEATGMVRAESDGEATVVCRFGEIVTETNLYAHAGSEGLHLYVNETQDKGTYVTVESLDPTAGPEIVIPDTYCGYPVTECRIYQYDCNFGRSGITSVKLSKNMQYFTFEDCVDLQTVDFNGATPDQIPYSAFKNCALLQSIDIPEGVDTIMSEAFEGCSSLERIVLPDSLVYLHSLAFTNCTSLSYVSFPGKPVDVGVGAFQNCTVHQLVFREGLTEIPSRLLNEIIYETDTIEISFPNSLVKLAPTDDPDATPAYDVDNYSWEESVQSRATENGLHYLGNDENPHLILWYTDKSANITEEPVIHPDTKIILGHSIRGDYTSVVVPEGVRSIESRAFYSDYLENVTLPSSLEYLETPFWRTNLFRERDDYGIASLTFAGNERYVMQDGILYSADKSTVYCVPSGATGATLTFPDETTTIPKYAISYNKALTTISLSKFVTSFGVTDYYICPNLAAFEVATGNAKYSSKDGVLYNSAKTEIIAVPRKVTNVEVPEGVTDIGGYFDGCAELKTLVVPTTVETFQNGALHGCSSLQTLTIPYLGEGLDSVSRPVNWREKRNSYFGWIFGMSDDTYYDSLTHQDLPKHDVTAHVPTTLEKLVVTKQVSIDNYTFYYCKNLKSIRFTSTDYEGGNWSGQIGTDAFSGCSTLEELVLATGFTKTFCQLLRPSMKTLVLPRSFTYDSFTLAISDYAGNNVFYEGSDNSLRNRFTNATFYGASEWKWVGDTPTPLSAANIAMQPAALPVINR